jgi:hypothetical protein
VIPTSKSTSVPSGNAELSVVAITGLVIGLLGVVVIICILLFRNKLETVFRRRTRKQEATEYTLPHSQGLVDSHHCEGNDNGDGQREEGSIVGSNPETKLPVDKTKGGSWKSTLYLGSIASLTVLLFNTSFAAWAASSHAVSDDTSVLFEGECRKARNINTGFHLVINILATLVLGASSYGMVRIYRLFYIHQTHNKLKLIHCRAMLECTDQTGPRSRPSKRRVAGRWDPQYTQSVPHTTEEAHLVDLLGCLVSSITSTACDPTNFYLTKVLVVLIAEI